MMKVNLIVLMRASVELLCTVNIEKNGRKGPNGVHIASAHHVDKTQIVVESNVASSSSGEQILRNQPRTVHFLLCEC